MKKYFLLIGLFALTFGLLSCSIEDDNEGNVGLNQEQFSNLLIGKWKFYAYYDGDWIVSDHDEISPGGIHNPFLRMQFNSDGTLPNALPWSSWQIKGKGTSSYFYNDIEYCSYEVELKDNSNTENDLTMQINFGRKTLVSLADLEIDDYPDILSVYISFRGYLFVRE